MLGVFLVKSCVASSAAVTRSEVGRLVNINQTMVVLYRKQSLEIWRLSSWLSHPSSLIMLVTHPGVREV